VFLRRLQEVATEGDPLGIGEALGGSRAGRRAPDLGVFQQPDQARPRATADQIEPLAALGVRTLVEDQIAGGGKALVVAERPAFGEVIVDLALHRLVLLRIQVASLDAEVLGQLAEEQPGHFATLPWRESRENRMGGEGRFVRAEVLEALVIHPEELQLVEVGVVEPPPLPKIPDQPVTDDEA